ncbi:MAG: phytoene/squalene synthase family protein [Methylococcaceae bacterium]
MSSAEMARPHIKVQDQPLPDDADILQARLLEGVSRTFALTIPQLPPALLRPVANAYLLCRIVDTIEDETALSSAEKREYCEQFVRVVQDREAPKPLSHSLASRLSDTTSPAEHELIGLIPEVVTITKNLELPQHLALSDCVRIMAGGMAEFQDKELRNGLPTLEETNRYCYFVAGVVGEMLTRLFCHYSAEMAQHREQLMKLSVSLGLVLQMTNILKDVWDDHSRGVCWLPQDVFAHNGYDLSHLVPGHNNPNFRAGYTQMIGIAQGHLRNALRYTLLIPAHETGLRDFCLWALGMAVLTLRKIYQNLDFSTSAEVKITRKAVKATVLTTRVCHSSDTLLKTAFKLAELGLPKAIDQIAVDGLSYSTVHH